ncbi:hypothetical protein P5705_21680 [Pseudomonas entomophila]|uniref:hypothetical protein n=1 Tax=Pseudomonas entomophila TaxID=312306 RepID=UPI00240691F3|nr:hypothetical protein [Pseudomonas entomophila]MDF9620266.1 hypothetical protein [Pseudomonas entomophila]
MAQTETPPPPNATRLLATSRIRAWHPWEPTDLLLEQGQRYYFRATGIWWDAWIRCDANGYQRTLTRKADAGLRCQAAEAHWFTLIGAIGQSNGSLFPIGDGSRWRDGWTAPADGRLYAFANDWEHWYWNNFFSVTLEVWQ